MTERERKLAAARFECPDRIPIRMSFTGDCWEVHGNDPLDELSDPAGGLMLLASVGPEVPLENADALATALERYCA